MTINPRETKGKEIAENNDIHRIGNGIYKVKSQSTLAVYDVLKTDSGFICSCPDHKFRKVCCKHIHAVEFSIKLREEIKQKNKIIINPVNIQDCLFCHSENIKKHGKRHNKSGDIQRYVCSDCHKTFSLNIGFEKMKHDPKGITTAMQLYYSGESLRNVAKSLKFMGMKVSHQTVYNWIEKYTKLMEKYLEKIVPQVGDVWRADEVYTKISGDMKYVFAMMDDESRYWIAQEVADTKFTHDARGLLQKAKKVTKTKPKVFITDGLLAYQKAHRKEFFTLANPKTKHLRTIRLAGDMNNNKMERLNGEWRDREKVMRGLKIKDTPIITGYQIYHNYFRPHMALDGKTPSEACGITINGDNKWITMIQNASSKT